MKTRTNEGWLRELKSDGELQTAALSDLRAYLVRAALYALQRRRNALQKLTSAGTHGGLREHDTGHATWAGASTVPVVVPADDTTSGGGVAGDAGVGDPRVSPARTNAFCVSSTVVST
jgi:hypothetical protein